MKKMINGKIIAKVPQNTLPYKCGERFMACTFDNNKYISTEEYFKTIEGAKEYIIKHPEYRFNKRENKRMDNKVLYMIIDKENKTKWGVADSFDRLVPICKYMLSSVAKQEDLKNFIVAWTNGENVKEKPFLEFCELQGIEKDIPDWRK